MQISHSLEALPADLLSSVAFWTMMKGSLPSMARVWAVAAACMLAFAAGAQAAHDVDVEDAPVDDPAAAGWELVLLKDAATEGAVCLDGSPGGYYIRRRNPAKFVLFHQGGGWCSSPTNCLQRANSSLGSSSFWSPTHPEGWENHYMVDTPPFDDFTAVYAMYCDGSSWTGNTSQAVSGTTVYYRGRRLLDAMLEHLLVEEGMNKATELLYGGCSAGGLTAYLHADYVASKMPTSTRIRAVASAMYSLNHAAFDGVPQFPSRMQWGYTTWNSSASMNEGCLAHYGLDDGWKCMFGSNLAPFVQTPLFVLNSKYDSWQQKAILGLNCTGNITTCIPAEEQFWVDYGHTMVDMLSTLPARHGIFVSNCHAHCESGNADWYNTTLNNVPMNKAFTDWYAASDKVLASAATADYHHIATCDVSPCGTDTCGDYR